MSIVGGILAGVGISKTTAYLFSAAATIGIVGSAAAPFMTNKSKPLADGKMGRMSNYKDVMGNDGFIIGKNMQLSKRHSYEGVLVIGPTGSGKTTQFNYPNLLELATEDNVIIATDPSGEMYRGSKHTLDERGIDVYRLNLERPRLSCGYDPIAFCQNKSDVFILAQTIIMNGNSSIEQTTGKGSDDAEWLNYATSLLDAFLLLVWSKKFKHIYRYTDNRELEIINELSAPENLPELLSFIHGSPESVLEATVLGNGYEPAIEEFISYKKAEKGDGLTASIKTVLEGATKSLRREEKFTNIMRRNDLNPKTLRKKGKVIFVQYDEGKANYYAPFLAVFYKQMMDTIISIPAHELKQAKSVFFLLDELANLGNVPGFPNYTTVCRKRDIALSGSIQAFSQLESKYGPHDAATIRDNLRTKIILSGTGDDAEYFSKFFDERGVQIDEQLYTRDLLSQIKIRQISNGYSIVFRNEKDPLIQKTVHIDPNA